MTVCGDDAMQRAGRQIAGAIVRGELSAPTIFLRGDLGVGKTTLVKGLVAGFGIEDAVMSPTFTLVEPYDLKTGSLFHFDLYRLESADELETLGLRDMMLPNNICVFEWPERARGLLPRAALDIAVDFAGEADGGSQCRSLSSNLPLAAVHQ